MALSSSATLLKAPRRMRFRVISAKKRSTMLSQEAEGEREFRRENVSRGQRDRARVLATPADFGRQRPHSHPSPAAKPRKVKGYSERDGKPSNQPIMGPKGSYQGPHRYGTACAAVTVASCGPVPSMIAANVRGGMNASGVRRRMCLPPCLHALRSRRTIERGPKRRRRSRSEPWLWRGESRPGSPVCAPAWPRADTEGTIARSRAGS
jgi:hypothetical protein